MAEALVLTINGRKFKATEDIYEWEDTKWVMYEHCDSERIAKSRLQSMKGCCLSREY